MITRKAKKAFWVTAGFVFLGLAYVGLVVPGIPWSTPLVISAYCFSKGSDRMHNWIYGHKIFGPFLTNWTTKKIFPTKLKFAMLLTMSSSLAIMWLSGIKPIGILSTGIFMALVAIWAWRFPGSQTEYDFRVSNNKKIGWLK